MIAEVSCHGTCHGSRGATVAVPHRTTVKGCWVSVEHYTQLRALLDPVPQLTEARRVLCIQPHPDDTDIALGATIALLAAQGTIITYLSVTDDAAGLTNADAELPYEARVRLRSSEQREAASILGVAEVRELGFADAGDWSVRELRNCLVDAIRTDEPDFVLSCDPWLPYEAHADHVRTGLAVAEAAILYQFPNTATAHYRAEYRLNAVGFFFTDKPNQFVDAAAYRELKLEAISAHKSQFTSEQINALDAVDHERGQRLAETTGAVWVEGVKCLRPEWLHVLPEAQWL